MSQRWVAFRDRVKKGRLTTKDTKGTKKNRIRSHVLLFLGALGALGALGGSLFS
jgi:hypothetical protein